jgi:hypothetical protein
VPAVEFIANSLENWDEKLGLRWLMVPWLLVPVGGSRVKMTENDQTQFFLGGWQIILTHTLPIGFHTV